MGRRPVAVGGRAVGSIVTLRDRTELTAMMRRMHVLTGLSTALRAQEHEFTNRLHVIALLLDLGRRTLAVGEALDDGDVRRRVLELGNLLVREGETLPKE